MDQAESPEDELPKWQRFLLPLGRHLRNASPVVTWLELTAAVLVLNILVQRDSVQAAVGPAVLFGTVMTLLSVRWRRKEEAVLYGTSPEHVARLYRRIKKTGQPPADPADRALLVRHIAHREAQMTRQHPIMLVLVVFIVAFPGLLIVLSRDWIQLLGLAVPIAIGAGYIWAIAHSRQQNARLMTLLYRVPLADQ